MKGIVFALGLLIAVTGCGGEPRIDASSDESVTKSVEKITAKMSEKEKSEFFLDYMLLTGEEMWKSVADGRSSTWTAKDTFKPIHGMTASEIRKKADAKRREDAVANLSNVAKKLDENNAAAKAEIEKLKNDLSKSEKKTEKKEEVLWVPHDRYCSIDGVDIKVVSVEVGKFRVERGGKDITEEIDTVMMMLKLEIKNSSRSKKFIFTSWQQEDDRLFSLKDNHGNEYRRFSVSRFQVSEKFKFQSESNKAIYPGDSFFEYIYLERPVDIEAQLFLDLPGKNVEANGRFRIKFPSSLISKN